MAKVLKVAVVDDNKLALKLMQRFLEEHLPDALILLFNSGVEFLEFYSGVSGVAPDVVVTDVMMPAMSGPEMVIEAKEQDYFKYTKFIALTGYLNASDAKWVASCSIDKIFYKPVNFDQLLLAINELTDTDANPDLFEEELNPKQMIAELIRLRVQSVDLAQKYIKRLISPQVFELMETRPDQLEPRSVEIAVGFADIRDFTPLTNRLQTREVGLLLGLFFDYVVECIQRHGGFVDKFVGDSVMWFHHTGTLQENSSQCLSSALAIQAGIDDLNRKIQEHLHMRIVIEIGVGLSCGTGDMGIFGARDHRIQFSVIGPPVNLSARLCSEAAGGEILIGGSIISFCDHPSELVGFQAIKGFDHEVELRRLLLSKEPAAEVTTTP